MLGRPDALPMSGPVPPLPHHPTADPNPPEAQAPHGGSTRALRQATVDTTVGLWIVVACALGLAVSGALTSTGRDAFRASPTVMAVAVAGSAAGVALLGISTRLTRRGRQGAEPLAAVGAIVGFVSVVVWLLRYALVSIAG